MKEKERYLSIDYGEKRIGIAITDPLRLFSYSLITLQNDDCFFINLKKILVEKNVKKIILGYPVKESGEKSKSTYLVEKFKKQLKHITKIPIEYIDESYSSKIAKDKIIESVKSKKKRREKARVDREAAAIILQDYLDTH